MNDEKQYAHNKVFFGLGTIGRDMFYSLTSTFLLVYLTEVLDLPDRTMWWMTGVFTILRIFDALNDPIMGVLVDNTRSKYGKFKPWILFGALSGGVAEILLFTDLGLRGAAYILVFILLYLTWDITYGANDIAYWAMMPSLSLDQKEREKIGSFARICANIGMFAVVVGVIPVTNALGKKLGSLTDAWFWFAVAVTVLMIGFQLFTLLGVREHKGEFKQENTTSLKGMARALFQNDQLLWTAVSMGLFMIGYCTTTSFGTYYFKYAYGDENMYSVFAAVLGVSQLAALALFPRVTRNWSRRKSYTISTILVVLGYAVFFFAPMNMIYIGVAGVLLFVGQAWIQLLMYMFVADTVDYGQWKLGKRNEGVTYSVMPFINKIGGALASGICAATLILSGINSAASPSDVTPGGLMILKVAMMVLPLVFIAASFLVYRFKFRIDETTFKKIVSDLRERGDIK